MSLRETLSSNSIHSDTAGSVSDGDGDGGAEREMEFLVSGDLLRSTIEGHLAKKMVSSVSETRHAIPSLFSSVMDK